MTPEDVLTFWFVETDEKAWWRKSKAFDDVVRRRFLPLYEQARAGELWHWRERGLGRLAEIIVLDQFPRNMFRDDARAFESDALALVLAQEAVRAGVPAQFETEGRPAAYRAFLLMPYMHSESRAVHREAVKLFAAKGLEDNYNFELRHKAIIDRFGRYPHRNALMGRKSSAEEEAFLKEPGSRF